MDLLIIGGTQFVGHHLTQAALARGDRVTLFNRGQTQAQVPAGVTWLRGDRRADLSALQGGRWDAVVDCCGYLPGEVDRMAQALDAQVGRYAFISSVSAYASSRQPNAEDAPLGSLPDDEADTEVVDGRTYGPLKALCEARLCHRLGPRALLVRPGLVVGPRDPTQRFTWWPARLARAAMDGKPVLAPGAPHAPLQFIDARDLAALVRTLLDTAAEGAFNAVAPPGFTNMADLLQACADAVGLAQPPLRWLNDATLLAREVRPWVDLPLWLPADGEHAAFMAVPNQRAVAAGLAVRPLAQTVADTLAWWRGLPADGRAFIKAGLSAEREQAVLAAAA